MPFSQTDTVQDDIALRCLSWFEYATYRYLVNRADPIGVSYPGEDNIAWGIGGESRNVQRALAVLHENGVFRYRRRNAFDPETRRKLNNCYQVSPEILIIAPAFQAEAWSEWNALIDKCGNVSIRLWSRINQHQEPTPEPKSGTKIRTNTTNDQDALTEKGQKQGQPPKNKHGTNHPNEFTHQREQRRESSVPPSRPKYVNPKAFNQECHDPANEQLALLIRDLGINLPLARGFVLEYGYDRSKSALAETVLMGEEARKPASVFRAILQTRLADEYAVARQKFFNNRQS